MAGQISRKMTDAQRAVAEKATAARKAARVAKNEARHQANLDYIAEHGLKTFPIERTVRVITKKGKETVVKEKTVIRMAAPNTIVQRHKNSLDDTRHKAWLEAQKGSPLEPSASTAQHLRAKAEAERQKRLQIVLP